MRREIGEWKRVLELLEACRSKGPSSASGDSLINFLLAEAKLECWLEEHQPTEKHLAGAKTALVETKKSILQALTQAGSLVNYLKELD